jgi:hypothetical protein
LARTALECIEGGTPVEIWFQDEARVGQKGTHAYIWAEVGSSPLMVRDNRHESAYIFGAICPHRGVGAGMITPAANAEMMNLHLTEIGTQVAPAHALCWVLSDLVPLRMLVMKVFDIFRRLPKSCAHLWLCAEICACE